MGGHQDCRSTKRIRIRNRKAGRTGRRISQVGRPRGGREKNRGSSEVAKGRRREITKGSSYITEVTKGNSEFAKGRKREITKGRRGGSKEKGLRSPKRKRRQRKRGTTEERKGRCPHQERGEPKEQTGILPETTGGGRRERVYKESLCRIPRKTFEKSSKEGPKRERKRKKEK